MICIVHNCKTEIWLATRGETEEAAIAGGWRFRGDGKAPELSTGAAICAAHVAAGEEANWKPVAAKGRKTT